jgi:hypothetical protein
MNSPDPAPTPTPPATIPWWKSNVLRALLTILLTQVIARVQSHYKVDFAVFGITITDAVNWTMDIISAAAVAWAAQSRITKPMPAVTFRKPPPADK